LLKLDEKPCRVSADFGNDCPGILVGHDIGFTFRDRSNSPIALIVGAHTTQRVQSSSKLYKTRIKWHLTQRDGLCSRGQHQYRSLTFHSKSCRQSCLSSAFRIVRHCHYQQQSSRALRPLRFGDCSDRSSSCFQRLFSSQMSAAPSRCAFHSFIRGKVNAEIPTPIWVTTPN
jgi:hypothetical protein